MTQDKPERNRSVLLLIVILASASFGLPTAHAAGDPMAGMTMGHPASRGAGMTEMMGAPGLLPFDVMVGQAGQWMVGYQYMYDKLDGNLDGTNEIGETTILEHFATAPTDMVMHMHMVMVMYAPTNRLTLMAMQSYVTMSMGELHRDGTRSVERSSGISDVELRGLYSLYAPNNLRHRILANFGAALPTGSINRLDAQGLRLEYPMQIGSGSFSLLPGLTYLGQALPWGWAADLGASLKLDRNDHGYKLGNRFQSSVSIARELPNWISLSAGARGEIWSNIDGSDRLLDPADEPTKDANMQGGKRFSALMGITLHPQRGLLKKQHFHALAEVPIAQSLDGPQLKRIWVIRLGWQIEF